MAGEGKRSYDEKCEELAEYFLTGEDGPASKDDAADLAQVIQDAIENWFAGKGGAVGHDRASDGHQAHL